MRKVLGWLAAAALAFAAGCGVRADGGGEAAAWQRAGRGTVRPWTAAAGEVQPRRVERIASKLQGAGVLVELAKEGERVPPGGVVARFETSQLEQDLARQEGEVERARQELASLEGAELPLEILDLEAAAGESEAEWAAEASFLATAEGLAARGLMGEGEVERQKERVAAAAQRLERQRKRLGLTREELHPARLGKARAALAAAEAARDFTKGQLALCEVRAEGGGVVSMVALPLGGELRAAEVGDTVYRNQTFMALPDVGEMVAETWVGERDWGRIEAGARAEVEAPGVGGRAEGVVESVGRIAHGGRYPVRVALEGAIDWPAGMSVVAKVAGAEATDVVRIRRASLQWSDGRAWVWAKGPDGAPVRRELALGLLDGEWAEVVDGLAEGDEYR